MPPRLGWHTDYIAQVAIVTPAPNPDDATTEEWQMSVNGIKYSPANDVTARTTLGVFVTRLGIINVSVQSVTRLWQDPATGDPVTEDITVL